MIALLQRVTGATVVVEGSTIGEIGRGLLVFIAVHRDDQERDIQRLAERILSYRVERRRSGQGVSVLRRACLGL
jgi:D-tyrosyl-tRNA(Tyr) deacylase